MIQYFSYMRFLLLLYMLIPCFLFGGDAPINDNGRIRPFTAYSKDWLSEFYHLSSIKKEHRDYLPLPIESAKELIWSLHFLGHKPFDSFPLFYSSGKRFSYDELTSQKLEEPLPTRIKIYELFGTYRENLEIPLHLSAFDLKMLPSASDPGIWLPLKSLTSLKDNPTAYPDEEFFKIKNAYTKLLRSFRNNDYQRSVQLQKELINLLARNYQTIAGKTILKGSHTTLKLPSVLQLTLENLYYRLPLVWITILLYALSLIFFIAKSRWGLWCFLPAFAFHTTTLAMRCVILGRPPVSNMSETLLFVPWVAAVFSCLLAVILKNRIPLAASAGTAVILLALNQTAYSSHELETVRPVLNSQFWLTVHVLMVVGSYGAFILSGILSHIYLIASSRQMPKMILQSLYIGTALLITGTILGGIWAAQSWGRFWDWDPKESWALISSAVYLVIIHAHYFRKIGALGLAVGSIIGLQFITFTWYGVNYILGVGLHSYGFGQGGELIYAIFTSFELFFAFFMLFFHLIRQKSHNNPLL